MRVVFGCGLLGLALTFSLGHLEAKDADSGRFGFSGPEIFPIDPQISLLHESRAGWNEWVGC